MKSSSFPSFTEDGDLRIPFLRGGLPDAQQNPPQPNSGVAHVIPRVVPFSTAVPEPSKSATGVSAQSLFPAQTQVPGRWFSERSHQFPGVPLSRVLKQVHIGKLQTPEQVRPPNHPSASKEKSSGFVAVQGT